MDIYCRCAVILDQLEAQKGSLKGLASKSGKANKARDDTRRLLAILIETLKYKTVLLDLIARTSLIKEETPLLAKLCQPVSSAKVEDGKGKGKGKAVPAKKGDWKSTQAPTMLSLLLVLVHDLLFSKRGISLPKEHKIYKSLSRHLTRLKAEKERIKLKNGYTKDEELQTKLEGDTSNHGAGEGEEGSLATRVRWMRVNEIKWSMQDALSWAVEHEYTQSSLGQVLASAQPNCFAIDDHIPSLLLFPKSLALKGFEPFEDARFIAQDKASCFPAFVLLGAGVDPNSEVIDATAAPGNKTTHLASLLQSGTISAYERDAQRFKTLQKMVASAGCKNVKPIKGDFLSLSPEDALHEKVTHILLDPSCSGSGTILDRLDHLSAVAAKDQKRINALAEFQLTILSHALRFKSVQKVVYSTCSVHPEENEHVIERVLSKPEFKDEWRLALREEVIPTWPIRGLPTAFSDPEMADSVIRCEPGLTHGFFVACLVRDAPTTDQGIEWSFGGEITHYDMDVAQ